jgi:hypothetical protein
MDDEVDVGVLAALELGRRRVSREQSGHDVDRQPLFQRAGREQHAPL